MQWVGGSDESALPRWAGPADLVGMKGAAGKSQLRARGFANVALSLAARYSLRHLLLPPVEGVCADNFGQRQDSGHPGHPQASPVSVRRDFRAIR